MPAATLSRSRMDDLVLRSAPQWREYVAIADRIARERPGRLLDWGCGYGQVSHLLRERAVDVTSFEYRDGHEAVTRERLEHFPDIEAVVSGDPVKLPFDSDSFDAALSCGVLEHVADPDGSLDELRRVLRAGGRLYVYKLPNRWSYLEHAAKRLGLYYHGKLPHDRVYDRGSAADLLERHGYALEELRRANVLPLTLPGALATRLARPIWYVNRLLSRPFAPIATNIELVATSGR